LAIAGAIVNYISFKEQIKNLLTYCLFFKVVEYNFLSYLFILQLIMCHIGV